MIYSHSHNIILSWPYERIMISLDTVLQLRVPQFSRCWFCSRTRLLEFDIMRFETCLSGRKYGIPTAQKMKFPADLVTFNEEILNRKLPFLCSVRTNFQHCLRKVSFYIVMTDSKKMNSRIEPCRITPFRIPGRENLI